LTILKISTRHLGRVGLAGIAMAAAAVVFAAAIVVRVMIAPVSLGPFSADLRASLNSVLPGLAVRFDDAALQWSRDEGRLNLVILGARVFDEDQRIIAQAPEAEVGLALGPFLRGHIVVRRIALVGVQLTLVHSKDGILRLGIGSERNQSDVLERIRDALAKTDRRSSSLDSLAVNKARLAFYEEETGAFIVAPKANLQIRTGSGTNGGPKGEVRAILDANIEISGKPARVEAVLHLPAKGNDINGDISISGLNVRSLATNAKYFAFLQPFDLNTDISGNFSFVHGTELRAADFGIGASGTVDGLGRPLHVRSFHISGRYDGVTGRLLIEDATLAGIQARAHLEGSGDLIFDHAGSVSKATLDLRLDKMAVNMPGVMDRAVTVTRAAIRGSYTPSTRTVSIDQAFVYGGQLSAKFGGHVILADNLSPEVDVDGNVAPMAIRDLLRYWPLQIGPGAREWIDTNVSTGRIGPILLHTHVPPGALDRSPLPESALSVTFPITGATVTYMHGLTPMTGVSGTAALTGDTAKAELGSGSIGPLRVASGHIVIPNLHISGTQGNISAHVDGTVPELLALIDQKPLQYPSRFKIRSASAQGIAGVDVAVRVPMLQSIRMDDVGISIKAAVSNLDLALNDHLGVADGNVNFDVNNSSLRATGKVALAGSPIGIDWTEVFQPKGTQSTRIIVNGALPEAARAQLGVHAAQYLTGPVGVTGELDGYRGRIQHAQLKLDLTPAAVSLRLFGYRKPAGIVAQAQLGLKMDASGTVRTADATFTGSDLDARATLHFGANGDMQALDVPSFRAGANNDYALNLTRDPVQGITVSVVGHSFDEEEMLRSDDNPRGAQPGERAEEAGEPYHITSKLDRVVLREGVIVSPFSFSVSGLGYKPRTLALNGMFSKTAPLSGSLVSAEDGTHVTLSAGDAGLLFKGLFGATSLKGGKLAIDALMATAPANADSAAADYTGKFTISDFTVTNQPFLTRLSSAGSFGGLADLMNGRGIAMDKAEVPFSLRGDVLTVRDAEATGPSLGLTADGYYDMKTNQLGLQGAFAPLYGINGIWSFIPIIGDVLTSKKGEGLLGVTYTASGSANDPKVSVNPLSIVTPGIFRRIFQGKPPSEPPAQANTLPPATAPKPQ
jgi:Protein of unknown function/AsmA-like C-terminal region